LQGQGFVFGTVVGGLRIVENKGNKQEKDKRKINDKIGKDEAKVKNGKTESKKRKR
jgi:cyclophilin family peptidyl-prolyl cis-trans isomerase